MMADETDAYHSMSIHPEDRYKTATYTAAGKLVQWTTVPQGMRNAPAELHRLKDKQYAAFDKNHFSYSFDDAALYHKEFAGFYKRVREFFTLCRSNGTVLSPSKLQLCPTELKYQGFIVKGNEWFKDPVAVKAILEHPIPRTNTEVMETLGLYRTYEEFISQFTRIAQPILRFLKTTGNNTWTMADWTDADDECIKQLFRELADATMLTLPDWNKTFWWCRDTSPQHGIAGVMGKN